MVEFKKIVEWQPAFDKRHDDPEKNYGIHGMELRFVLKGPEAATQFLIYTNWLMKHCQQEADRLHHDRFPHLVCHPLPVDVGYHSLRRVEPNQEPHDECEYLDGRRCYYDGSSNLALDLYWRFVAGGDAVVWRELEERYWDVIQMAAVLPLATGPTGESEEVVEGP